MITHAASRKQYTVLLDRPEVRSFFVANLDFGMIHYRRKNAPLLIWNH